MFHSDGNAGSTTLTRDNGNGTKTEKVYASVDDRKVAERNQGSCANYQPTPLYVFTVDKP